MGAGRDDEGGHVRGNAVIEDIGMGASRWKARPDWPFQHTESFGRFRERALVQVKFS